MSNRSEHGSLQTRVSPGRVVQVTAPSRLHFGLFSFGHLSGRQYGGVGAMIDTAAVQLKVEAAAELAVDGPMAERVREFATRWAQFHQMPSIPQCRIIIQPGAMQHVGLGTGTQLGLSVAAALNAFYGMPAPTPPELAISVQRGLRSAVGTYGFALGGLIVERGKTRREVIAPLDARIELPEHWRFVLIQAEQSAGLSGAAEQSAFEQLPPVPEGTTARLVAEVRDHMLPAAIQAEFDEFSSSVYEYGKIAGNCFASIQGGPYNGPRLSELVDIARSLGVAGVGQSSWGPTLFAILPSQAEAERFVAEMEQRADTEHTNYVIAGPNNRGADVKLLSGDAE